MLCAAAAGLAIVLGVATWVTWTATAGLCDSKFPPRSTTYPIPLFVFVAIVAFVQGHLTGQVGMVPRRHGWRPQRREEEELGEGRWSNVMAVVAVNGAVTIFLFLVTALMLVEAATLATGHWPITYYTRCATFAGPPISLAAVAIYSFVVGRWLWVFKRPSPSAAARRQDGVHLRGVQVGLVVLVILVVVALAALVERSLMFPNAGILLVAFVGFGLMLALAIFDVRIITRSGHPVGSWVQAWARRYPILAFLLVMVLGMLVGHFFWSTAPLCPPTVAVGQTVDADCIRQVTPGQS